MPTLTAYATIYIIRTRRWNNLKISPRRAIFIWRSAIGEFSERDSRDGLCQFARLPYHSLTGRDGGKLGGLAQLNIQVPEQHMGRIEDAHHIICHMICYCFMDTE